MKTVGFIGCGSMGRMLMDGFLSARVLRPEEILVSSRTLAKAVSQKRRWPGLRISRHNQLVARQSRMVFLCVKPLDVTGVLEEISGVLAGQAHLVSIAAGVTIAHLEKYFAGEITKVIPSLTAEVKAGISLICHNSRVTPLDAGRVERLFRSLGQVMRIKERDFEVAADLTSCAPGLIAAIFQLFVEAGLKHSRLDRKMAQEMVVATLAGTADLLKQGSSFNEVIARVATKGGITEEAVRILDRRLPSVFNEMFLKTLEKHHLLKGLVQKQRIRSHTVLQSDIGSCDR